MNSKFLNPTTRLPAVLGLSRVPLFRRANHGIPLRDQNTIWKRLCIRPLSTGGHDFSWKFPKPPPPPSQQELYAKGLPILHQASLHASEGRILLSGWKHEDGSMDIATYKDVLGKARLVSETILPNIGTGQRNLVAHLNVPGWEYVATQWGTWGAGYGSVPLALTQKPAEMAHVLEQANPKFILAGGNCTLEAGGKSTHEPPNIDDLYQAAEDVGMKDRVLTLSDILNQQSTVIDDSYSLGSDGVVHSLDDTALLLFTSGTTGKPKAAVLTHRNIYHQVTDLIHAWEWQPSDVAIHVLPLHHVHGVINLLSCAAYIGARLEFQPFHAENLWKQWASTSPTTPLPKPNLLMAVPTIYAKLLEGADKLPKETIDAAVENTLNPMRLMVSGSAALPVSVLERWKKLTRGHTLLERYGMTEFAMALSNPYREEPGEDESRVQMRRPGYVGRPLPSVQVRLVNPDTGEEILSPGVSGELQVKGPTVFQQYLNREDATKEAFTEDGFFKTGDIAQYDGGNIQSYRILGRASVDIIKSGGHKLSALEIERELLEHPDVAEVAVLGVPDEIWGERVAMICRLKSGKEPLALEELREWCGDRLSKEKVPSRLLLVKEIPKNAMGKVNKKNLATLFEESS